MADNFSTLRARLTSLSGALLSPEQLMDLLESVVNLGGGIRIELDDLRFSLIRRDGRFVLKNEHRQSTMPPRR